MTHRYYELSISQTKITYIHVNNNYKTFLAEILNNNITFYKLIIINSMQTKHNRLCGNGFLFIRPDRRHTVLCKNINMYAICMRA